jgi:hypothetical protein
MLLQHRLVVFDMGFNRIFQRALCAMAARPFRVSNEVIAELMPSRCKPRSAEPT